MPRTMDNIGFYAALGFVPGHLTVTLTLDAALGEDDGLALIVDLRKASPDCTVCVVSSAPYADDVSARAAGADLFLPKGTDPDVVLDRALTLHLGARSD